MPSTNSSSSSSRSSLLCWLLILCTKSSSFTILPQHKKTPIATFPRRRHVLLNRNNNLKTTKHNNDDHQEEELLEQQNEAWQSLAEYHVGTWIGTARSFSVSNNDRAAGIVRRRRTVHNYTTTIHFDATDGLSETTTTTHTATTSTSTRTIPWGTSNWDVDSVDASYSFDQQQNGDLLLPTAWTHNNNNNNIDFLIEHCLTASNDERVRCIVLYGGTNNGDEEKKLQRIVVCKERRWCPDTTTTTTSTSSSVLQQQQQQQLTAYDMLEMQTDIDRLVDTITGGSSSEQQQQQQPHRHPRPPEPMASTDITTLTPPSLLQPYRILTSDSRIRRQLVFVWLGDAVIRDCAAVHTQQKGFGGASSTKPIPPVAFASWTLGVQKVAWQWKWPASLEDGVVVQTTNVGKGMGAQILVGMQEQQQQQQQLLGDIWVYELPRRGGQGDDEDEEEDDDAMICIDWNDHGSVSCWIDGYVGIQVPRYYYSTPTTSTRSRRRSSVFSTELTLLLQQQQGGKNEVVCSKISRNYNYEHQFKQGVTSFYTLHNDDDDGDDKIEEDSTK